MSQGDQSIANQAGAAFRADLNAELQALVSQSSGASAPATTYAYQWWADTTTGLLKRRNAANSAWITVGLLDGTLLQSPSDPLLINNKVLRLGIAAGNVGAFLQLQGWSSTNKNWELSADGSTAGLHFRPSTAAGGTTFSTDALLLGEAGQLAWGTGVANFGTITKRKTADESVTSSTTLQDDDHLTFAIAASEEWNIDFQLRLNSAINLSNMGMKAAITVPSGATLDALGQITTIDKSATTSGTAMDFITTNFNNTDVCMRIKVWVLNGATPGNVTLQWCQSTSNGTALKLLKGSALYATRVA